MFSKKRQKTLQKIFQINDLLDSEDEVHELEQDILELENEIEYLSSHFSSLLNINESITIDTSNLISINTIKTKIAELPRTVIANNALSKRQFNIDQSILDYNLEEAEQDWKIDYIQFKYAERDKTTFAQDWSFGMGIEIPLKNATRIEKNEFMLEKIELENRLKLQETSLNEQLKKSYQEIESKLQQYDLANTQLNESQLLFSFENYPQFRDADPMVFIESKIKYIEARSKQIKS